MNEPSWWQTGVIYQIYPRSFMDTNDDGVGDLAGIRARLDYLQWLGVDALWLSPIQPSPMKDFGYDISDYCDVDPLFGRLDDLRDLLDDLHARGMKLVLDFVPNHTSDQHPWFLESRQSRDNSRHDWYLWRDPGPDGGPPNNWLSSFGGSGWAFEPRRGQYFFHAFLEEQPDLNWRNPAVREAMLEQMRFWLELGVDGFRIDVIWHLVKDEQFRDNPINPDFRPQTGDHNRLLTTYSADQPEVHEVIRGFRQLLDQYPQRMMVGEIYLPLERLMSYYGSAGDGVHLPFNFQLIRHPWDAEAIAATIDRYEAALPAGGWPNWVLGNHDNHRLATRVGAQHCRIAAFLLLTLRGTPTLYYGDEIGMQDVPVPAEAVQDPVEGRMPGLGLGRDPERSPMQWDDGPFAGFSRVRPWLPIAADHVQVNVASLRSSPTSLLNLYHQLIAIRRAEPALALGHYRRFATPPQVLGYLREHNERRLLVLLNFSAQAQEVALGMAEGRICLSSLLDRPAQTVAESVTLRAHEGLLLDLTCE
ncbi:DUF3459 domain-containing protein [Pseudomonas sp. CK-NBRI-02]|uniref:alpha-amylase family glycosyl hydrolase n=1 Tax=Pseudomonas sp. CK-NBRI-02 TaxID=2249759 RepID=UPI0003A95153|nr:alpha-amylase family glycosyl hydrolase [Pseudomonas sp. CK-NBRI-02]TYO69346.1 DUF3459 domain-containing protein [Pseudomonas sp. CK-NBRI-02]